MCLQVPNLVLAFSLYLRHNVAMAITRRQREVYDFISRFVTEHGYSPSFEEIGEGLTKLARDRAQAYLEPGEEGSTDARLQSQPLN